MTTSTRLSLFFLGAMALVLVGFSTAIYSLVAWRMSAQLDDELDATVSVIVASIEVHPDRVEWEPLQRRITLGNGADLSQVRWTLRDERGVLVDRSENLKGEPNDWSPLSANTWRFIARSLRQGDFAEHAIEMSDIPTDPSDPQPLNNGTAARRSFFITAAQSETPHREMLAYLLMALAAVSAVLWLSFAAASQWLCRRALAPVLRMAGEARAIQATNDGAAVLRIPATHDELSELATAFNSLLAALRDKVEQQRRFAGDASHQLRTPLTALLTAVDVASRQPRSAEEYQHVLEVVSRRGRDLQQIVETLLTLTRSDALASLPPPEQIELGAWTRRRLTRWQDSPRSADMQLIGADREVVISTQPALLGQVFDNLVDNAIKYSPDGTPIRIEIASPRCETNCNGRGRSVSLAVIDRGHGIAASELSHVFEPFFRSQSAHLKGVAGVGLGLTIAQRLTAMLGGKIAVENEASGGARFRITIPCEAESIAPIDDSQISAARSLPHIAHEGDDRSAASLASGPQMCDDNRQPT